MYPQPFARGPVKPLAVFEGWECEAGWQAGVGHRHQAFLTRVTPDADSQRKTTNRSSPEVISLSKNFQSNFTAAE